MAEEKKMTIEDLARLMQGEFTGVNGRLDVMEEDVKILKADVGEIKMNSSELFVKLDEFITLYRDAKQELTMLSAHMRRLEERIEKLEQGK